MRRSNEQCVYTIELLFEIVFKLECIFSANLLFLFLVCQVDDLLYLLQQRIFGGQI
jgi:hypothetical protein